MYAYLYFGITLLCIFSIFENFKSAQKLSFFKFNIILFLVLMTSTNIFDFLFELGHDFKVIRSILRIFVMISFVNLFYIVANIKISKILFLFEGFILLIYTILIFNGFEFMSIFNGNITFQPSVQNKISFLILNGFILFSMVYSLSIIFKRTDNHNLYQIKVKRWALFMAAFLIIVFTLILGGFIIHFIDLNTTIIDSRIAFITLRFLLILFILFRPKFIDESGFSMKFENIKPANGALSSSNFDFLFYRGHYFLNAEADLDDFSLKLNHSKKEVSEFIKNNFNESFIELLNKNRVIYFQELLKSKKYQQFTIEALSEMSGFGTKRSMYNSFKNYVGITPTEFIDSLK